MKKNKAYIISHAHWDREWRYPIWQTRKDLERMMSNLLNLLEKDSRYKCFVTDSQVVVIEDYLQVRPEEKDRITKLVKNKRMEIGPWYTLPEYYPIDGECIIRNLLKGDRVSKKYGGAMKIGYTTFGWGQPGQLPQIYKNFGIDTVIGGKNIDPSRTKYNEFIWEGCDGTKILTTKLGVQGRANFFKFVVIPVVFGKDNIGNNWKYEWNSQGLIYHNADIENYWQDYHRYFRNEQDAFIPERVKPGIENVLKTTSGTSIPQDAVYFDGGDFTFSQPMLCDIIEQANKDFDNVEFIHCTLDEYASKLKEKIDLNKLSIVKGEWRDGPEPDVSANALAFRSDLKHANKAAQRALINISEPANTIAELLGGENNSAYLDLAWNYLLKTHCHDSLHGVVQDKTSRDTSYRIEQAKELADTVTNSAVKYIIRNIKFPNDSQGISIVLFNTLPFERNEIVKAVIETPIEWQARELFLVDSKGNEIPTTLLSIEPVKLAIDEEDCRPWPYHAHRHFVEFDAGTIPAMGYKCFTVKVKNTLNNQIASWPIPQLKKNSLFKKPNVLENEFLKLTLNSNGTFDLFDKETGKEFKSLHYFEDSGDAGCGWIRYEPANNKTYTSLTSKVDNWISNDTEFSGTFVTKITMDLPLDCDKKTGEFDLYASSRNHATRPFEIFSEITLKKNSKKIEISTYFENNITHHRLRVLFPSDLTDAVHCDSEGHFIVDHREIEPKRNNEGYYHAGMNTQPHQYFVDVCDGKNGLMLINDGLCEYEVTSDSSRTMALTLLRSTKMRICTEPRVGSEYPNQNSWFGLNKYKFSYSIYPHKGNWQQAQAYQHARTFTVPMKIVQTNMHKFGTMPQEKSFFSINGNLQLSCFKKAQDNGNVVIRIYNPSDKPQKGTLQFDLKIKSAYRINMNEEQIEELKPSGQKINMDLGPGKIETIEVALHKS
jgi:mannosylglycerate hydrolase